MLCCQFNREPDVAKSDPQGRVRKVLSPYSVTKGATKSLASDNLMHPYKNVLFTFLMVKTQNKANEMQQKIKE